MQKISQAGETACAWLAANDEKVHKVALAAIALTIIFMNAHPLGLLSIGVGFVLGRFCENHVQNCAKKIDRLWDRTQTSSIICLSGVAFMAKCFFWQLAGLGLGYVLSGASVTFKPNSEELDGIGDSNDANDVNGEDEVPPQLEEEPGVGFDVGESW